MNINEKIKEMSSISELKEIAKYISKEEFLKKVINYNNACPKIINLEDCGDHGICSTTPCYSCWENAIKDIKFKGENNMENKIDYDREYKIQDILYMKEGLEFIASNEMLYKIKDENLYVYSNYIWMKSENPINQILNMTFKLNKKDKKVSFEEAIQAYGKEVYCIWIDTADMKHKSEYKIYSNESILKDQNEDPISPVEIFEGEWYIKED